jgi:gamma-glutamylaminecyclotransferase
MVKVFVYGTLKRGDHIRGLDRISTDINYLGEATTADTSYSLYDLGAFPAVTMQGNNKILGQVWEIPEQVLEDQLDLIEGYPDFYTRSQVETTLGTAWMYHIEDINKYASASVYAPEGGEVSWDR